MRGLGRPFVFGAPDTHCESELSVFALPEVKELDSLAGVQTVRRPPRCSAAPAVEPSP